MKLAEILGYQLAMARSASQRNVQRLLADTPFRPTDTAALMLVSEQPGCDQTTLGRILAANRSVGMKVASRLEAQGLLTRGPGRDRRSLGLFITAEGERVLADLIVRHSVAEAQLTANLKPGERETLLALLTKIKTSIENLEEDLESNSDSEFSVTQ